MKKILCISAVILAILGFFDAGYLTWEHFQDTIPPCSTSVFALDCGAVLKSSYATIAGIIPVALLGFLHYSLFLTLILTHCVLKKNLPKYLLLLQSAAALVFSVFLLYLMFFVIRSLCFYCLISALISILLFSLTNILFAQERKQMTISFIAYMYMLLLKKLFFLLPAEVIHTQMTQFGELLGSNPVTRFVLTTLFQVNQPLLHQTVAGLKFTSPIGLAAGFDYEAQLTQTVGSLGFGFASVGTITHHAYGGNPKPQLGRLPKSQSLLVNKGFRNLGAKTTVQKLTLKHFKLPIGISIGRSNITTLKTLSQSIQDICTTFKQFETAPVAHAYYELNISCPNLSGKISFYPPENLDKLLTQIDKLKLQKPLFVKMPIDKTDAEFLALLKVIAKHSPVGVIIGNLQTKRNHPSLNPVEVAKFPVGNFSGKPTFADSNRLISVCFKQYKKRFIIIGCGGVFSPQDAYTKIKAGATLVQLITGMIYEGPQLIAKINLELPALLKKDGFSHLSSAIGTKV